MYAPSMLINAVPGSTLAVIYACPTPFNIFKIIVRSMCAYARLQWSEHVHAYRCMFLGSRFGGSKDYHVLTSVFNFRLNFAFVSVLGAKIYHLEKDGLVTKESH